MVYIVDDSAVIGCTTIRFEGHLPTSTSRAQNEIVPSIESMYCPSTFPHTRLHDSWDTCSMFDGFECDLHKNVHCIVGSK